MRTLILVAVALALAGCSTLGDTSQQIVNQAEPTVVHDGQGRAWLWLKGLVKMPRMSEFDLKPAEAPKP